MIRRVFFFFYLSVCEQAPSCKVKQQLSTRHIGEPKTFVSFVVIKKFENFFLCF